MASIIVRGTTFPLALLIEPIKSNLPAEGGAHHLSSFACTSRRVQLVLGGANLEHDIDMDDARAGSAFDIMVQKSAGERLQEQSVVGFVEKQHI